MVKGSVGVQKKKAKINGIITHFKKRDQSENLWIIKTPEVTFTLSIDDESLSRAERIE